MFKDEPIDEEVIVISEAVFRLVHIKAEMPRNVKSEELINYRAPTLVIASERDGIFPAIKIVKCIILTA